jgi:hypothetical protein
MSQNRICLSCGGMLIPPLKDLCQGCNELLQEHINNSQEKDNLDDSLNYSTSNITSVATSRQATEASVRQATEATVRQATEVKEQMDCCHRQLLVDDYSVIDSDNQVCLRK